MEICRAMLHLLQFRAGIVKNGLSLHCNAMVLHHTKPLSAVKGYRLYEV